MNNESKIKQAESDGKLVKGKTVILVEGYGIYRIGVYNGREVFDGRSIILIGKSGDYIDSIGSMLIVKETEDII